MPAQLAPSQWLRPSMCVLPPPCICPSPVITTFSGLVASTVMCIVIVFGAAPQVVLSSTLVLDFDSTFWLHSWSPSCFLSHWSSSRSFGATQYLRVCVRGWPERTRIACSMAARRSGGSLEDRSEERRVGKECRS